MCLKHFSKSAFCHCTRPCCLYVCFLDILSFQLRGKFRTGLLQSVFSKPFLIYMEWIIVFLLLERRFVLLRFYARLFSNFFNHSWLITGWEGIPFLALLCALLNIHDCQSYVSTEFALDLYFLTSSVSTSVSSSISSSVSTSTSVSRFVLTNIWLIFVLTFILWTLF